MDDDVTVRIAGPLDSGGIAALRRAWTEESLGRAATDPEFGERFAGWHAVESGRRVSVVAEWDGALVGMVHLAVFERMPAPERMASRWGYLANAYVRPEHRDGGIGAAMVDLLLRRARELGCVRVVLAPSERSVPFYERAGFGPATMLMAAVLGP
jgi:GNAT superfamily N-acetyltransferase